MADTKQIVLDAMKNAAKPLRSGEIAELTQLDKKEVEKIIKQLQKEGKINSPVRCCYAPVE